MADKKGASRKARVRKEPGSTIPLAARPDPAPPVQEKGQFQDLEQDPAEKSLHEAFQKNLTEEVQRDGTERSLREAFQKNQTALVQAAELLTQGAETVFQH